MEELYKKAHAEIRKNPDRLKVVKKNKPVRETVTKAPGLVQKNSKGAKWLRQLKSTSALKKHRVAMRIRKAMGMDV